MSQWVAGFTGLILTETHEVLLIDRTSSNNSYTFTDGASAPSNGCLDPSSEGWITDCFNDDVEMHLCNEDLYVCIISPFVFEV